MKIEEISNKLQRKIGYKKGELLQSIQTLKQEAIKAGDEPKANMLWCYETICNIQSSYLFVYEHLKKGQLGNDELDDSGFDSEKSREYETAWNELERCEIEIEELEENFCIKGTDLQDYSIYTILQDIKRLQGLFPYRVFTSREMLIKSQECSICGKTISVRKPCGHVPGKIYMGKMCLRRITDAEFVNENIVTKPLDKYAILKLQGQKFDFTLLDYIIPRIAPYSHWEYSVEKRLKPEYMRIGRNMLCPCGSGKKYKYCIRNNPNDHYEEHYKFSVGR